MDDLKSRKRKAKDESRIYLAALCLVLIFSAGLTLAFFYGITPLNQSDNYLYNLFAHHVAVVGITGFVGTGADGMKYIVIGSMAVLYSLFGYSPFTSVFFDLLMFLGTVAVVYLIGSELYNRKAGLVSALLYGALPLAVIQASSVGDDVQMAFFASLAVLMMILATKNERKKIFYALSAFFAVIGFLSVPETLIIIPFLLLILLFDTVKHMNRKQLLRIASFAVGILCAVSIIALLGYLTAGNPLYIYTTDSSWYSNYCGQMSCGYGISSLRTYASELLPYNVAWVASQAIAHPSFVSLLSAWDASVSNANAIWFGYLIGAYFYIALLAAAYLLLKFDKRVAVPGLWVFSTLIYLAYGPMSLKNFLPIQPQYQRFTLIFGPALALLIGFFIVRLMESRKGAKKGIGTRAKQVFAMALLLALLAESCISISYIGYSQYGYLYPLLKVASFVNALPPNTTVVRPNPIPLEEYSNYKFNLVNGPWDGCDGIVNDSYVVSFANSILEQDCGLSVAYVPPARPVWLTKYEPSIYTFFGNFTNVTVYYKN